MIFGNIWSMGYFLLAKCNRLLLLLDYFISLRMYKFYNIWKRININVEISIFRHGGQGQGLIMHLVVRVQRGKESADAYRLLPMVRTLLPSRNS